MEIGRERLFTRLVQWKNASVRKPLILQGARQVGKTWLLKKFGRDYFSDTAYFNFDQQPDLKQFFQDGKVPEKIVQNLSLVHGRPIHAQSTLIVFDEIQECNEALNALKYFSEEAPEYCIACAGSLLGVSMSRGASFPVGKVDFLQIHPVTFSEFLHHADRKLYSYLEDLQGIGPIPDIFFNPLKSTLKLYFLSGGMPEAAVSIINERDLEKTQQILQNILNAYSLDFSKYVENRVVPKINYIWSSLPSQLARENKKFLYQTVRPGARAREYEDALLWLIHAGLVNQIFCTTRPALPLSSYDDLTAFKIYLNDVGLLRRLSKLDPVAITEGDRLFTEFRGALTENFILQSLSAQFEGTPRYWRSGNSAEIDFLVQFHNMIIPVEVKSDENVRSKSLAFYRKSFSPEISIRFSLRNFNQDNGLINIPLFMADYTKGILENNKA